MTDMNEPGGLPLPDATTQMPATAAGPLPEIDPPATPWYRKRWVPLAVLGVAGGLALAGFLLSQALDDDVPGTVNILRFDRVDVDGNPVEREVIGEVIGQPGDEELFLWLAPPNALAPQPAVATTRASSGRAEFQWAPTNEVEVPAEWRSTITLTEVFGAEQSLLATEFECSLQRRGKDAGLVALAVQFDNPADLTLPRTATYSFPGFSFVPTDVLTCLVPNGVAVPPETTTTTTVPPETTTTTLPPETTTTTTTLPPETTTTTVPADTTTTLPPETTTTTVPSETTTTVAAQGTVMDVIDNRADLSRLRDLIDLAGLRGTLSDPAATLTMFTPNNEAFAAAESAPDAPDYSDPNVVQAILLTHVHNGGKLPIVDVLALPEITVVEPGPHAIDAAAQTIGGIGIIEVDVDGGNGFLDVLSGVLTPAAA